jgi:hypothetical protein
MSKPNRTAMLVIAAAMLTLGASAQAPQFPADGRGGFWIAGPEDSILMLYNGSDGKGHTAVSTDTGLTWNVVAGFDLAAGPVTRMTDGSLVMVTHDSEHGRGWIRSLDHGRTWSDLTPIPIEFRYRVYSWGPITEMTDGRWAYTPYAQNGNLDADALILWSADRGRTWSKPIAFPTPIDGNKGLTEVALVQLGKHDLLAAIRSDDVENGGFDGTYFSYSSDGLTWSTPQPLGDMARQPHFFRLADCWVLTYRQWLPASKTNFSAMRFSVDGHAWSRPYRVQQGVQDGACLVQSKGRLMAFNQRYPQASVRTRKVISIPNRNDWFASQTAKMLVSE